VSQTPNTKPFLGINILVVSAWPPEQQWLAENIGSHSSAVSFFSAGVGSLQAALNLSDFLKAQSVAGKSFQLIIFLATAGVYQGSHSKNLKSGVLFEPFVCFSQAVSWLDALVETGASFVPPQIKIEFQRLLHPLNLSRLNVYEPEQLKKCFSCYAIHSQDSLILKLLEEEKISCGDLENLEFFGVATVAQRLKIPSLGIFGVSNIVGSCAHSQWKCFHKISSDMAGAAALKLIDKLSACSIDIVSF
jgi:hypothetical protein